MWNSVNDKQDQGIKATMDESPAMTIEFLRARLSAERSISKTARQRAEELAKRVVELEEQLKVVTIQRKRAEKATTDILTILENSGIGDFPDSYLSSSDHEGVLNESKEGVHCTNEEQSLTDSRPGLEFQDSSRNGGSLSWKNCIDSPPSLGRKSRIDQARRANNFVSAGGSPTKRRLAKSRRHTKQETRSEAIEVQDASIMHDVQENGSNCSRENPEILKDESKFQDEKLFYAGVVKDSAKSARKETDDGFLSEGSDRDADMEQALEHQAQLIGQYEEEETAQREWEEKFRDSNSCTPDSCEPGNRSDVTEERDEIMIKSAGTVDTITRAAQEGKSGMEEVCHGGDANVKSSPKRCLPPHLDNRCSQQQEGNSSTVNESETDFPEFSFPGQENLKAKSNEKHRQEWSENNSSYSHGSSEHQARQKVSSSQVSGSTYISESSGAELQVARHHQTPNGLGGVLEALQRAKLSLKDELNRLPRQSSPGGLPLRAIEAPVPATKTGGSVEIPIGSAGLFRVPSYMHFETPANPSLLRPYSDTGPSRTRYNNSGEVGFPTHDRYTYGPNFALQSDMSTRRLLSDSYMDMGRRLPASSRRSSSFDIPSQVSARSIGTDPYMDMGVGLPASRRYDYSAHPDMMPRMLTNDVLPKHYPNSGSVRPTGDHYYNAYDQNRSNVHTRR